MHKQRSPLSHISEKRHRALAIYSHSSFRVVSADREQRLRRALAIYSHSSFRVVSADREQRLRRALAIYSHSIVPGGFEVMS